MPFVCFARAFVQSDLVEVFRNHQRQKQKMRRPTCLGFFTQSVRQFGRERMFTRSEEAATHVDDRKEAEKLFVHLPL